MKKKITMGDVPSGQLPSAKEVSRDSKENEATVSPLVANKSKYHLGEDDFFNINFGVLHYDGRWRIVDVDKLESFPDAEEHWVKLKMCSYGLQNWIRDKATSYDRLNRIHRYDSDLANRIKIQKLLVDWSFSKEDESCKIHHVNGVMSDESYGMFERMHPNIVNHIISKMNDIIEYNG